MMVVGEQLSSRLLTVGLMVIQESHGYQIAIFGITPSTKPSGFQINKKRPDQLPK
jgi:hypothetical protein